MVEDLSTQPFLFADDSSLIDIVKNYILTSLRLNSDLQKILSWTKKWLMELNPSKSKEVCFSRKRTPPIHSPLFLGNTSIQSVKDHKHIGVTLTSTMSWTTHISQMIAKVSKKVSTFNSLKFKLPRQILEVIYKSFIGTLLEYTDVV